MGRKPNTPSDPNSALKVQQTIGFQGSLLKTLLQARSWGDMKNVQQVRGKWIVRITVPEALRGIVGVPGVGGEGFAVRFQHSRKVGILANVFCLETR